ncbi:MAG: hypothetical protein PVH00_10575 [Gemmatimonadota bacterium]|jgi:hypothetical protein
MSIFGSKVLTGSVLAVIGLITVKIVMALIGAVTGLFSLLVSLLPILLVGWLVLKVLKHFTKDKKPAYE